MEIILVVVCLVIGFVVGYILGVSKSDRESYNSYHKKNKETKGGPYSK